MTKPQANHVLPQALESQFKKLFPNLNIHDPKWGAWVEAGLHQQWTRRYQAAWERWLAKNTDPTIAQVEAQAAALAKAFGYPWP